MAGEIRKRQRVKEGAILAQTRFGRPIVAEEAMVRSIFGDDLAFGRVDNTAGGQYIDWRVGAAEAVDHASDEVQAFFERLRGSCARARRLSAEMKVLRPVDDHHVRMTAEEWRRFGLCLGAAARGEDEGPILVDRRRLQSAIDVLEKTAMTVRIAIGEGRDGQVVREDGKLELLGWGVIPFGLGEDAGTLPPALTLSHETVAKSEGGAIIFSWRDHPDYADGYRLCRYDEVRQEWETVARIPAGSDQHEVPFEGERHEGEYYLETNGGLGKVMSEVVQVDEALPAGALAAAAARPAARAADRPAPEPEPAATEPSGSDEPGLASARVSSGEVFRGVVEEEERRTGFFGPGGPWSWQGLLRLLLAVLLAVLLVLLMSYLFHACWPASVQEKRPVQNVTEHRGRERSPREQPRGAGEADRARGRVQDVGSTSDETGREPPAKPETDTAGRERLADLGLERDTKPGDRQAAAEGPKAEESRARGADAREASAETRREAEPDRERRTESASKRSSETQDAQVRSRRDPAREVEKDPEAGEVKRNPRTREPEPEREPERVEVTERSVRPVPVAIPRRAPKPPPSQEPADDLQGVHQQIHLPLKLSSWFSAGAGTSFDPDRLAFGVSLAIRPSDASFEAIRSGKLNQPMLAKVGLRDSDHQARLLHGPREPFWHDLELDPTFVPQTLDKLLFATAGGTDGVRFERSPSRDGKLQKFRVYGKECLFWVVLNATPREQQRSNWYEDYEWCLTPREANNSRELPDDWAVEARRMFVKLSMKAGERPIAGQLVLRNRKGDQLAASQEFRLERR